MKKNELVKNTRTIFHSCQVEFIHFFNDSAMYVTFLVLSLMVSFLYSTVYKNEIIENTLVSVVDLDNSVLSRNYIRMLDATQQVKVETVSNSMEQAKREFNQGTTFGILYIPNDFEKDIKTNRQAKVIIYSDASNMLHNKAISSAAASATGTFNAQLEINKSLHKGLNYDNSIKTRRSINAITKTLFNPYGGYATFLLPVVYLIIIQTLLLSAIGVLGGTFREYKKYFSIFYLQEGKHLKIVPVLIGRALAYLILCILIFSIICTGWFSFFGLPFRSSLLDALIYLIPFFLAVIFLGFSLMGIFKKREDAAMSVTFISIPTVFLSGISWPPAAFPTWVNILSYAFPSTLASRGFVQLSQYEASFYDVKVMWMFLWLTAFFYFILAILVNLKLKFNSTTFKQELD